MHGFEDVAPEVHAPAGKRWFGELNRYHWFVLFVAALGWMFDCLDQQLFILARPAAMVDLVPGSTSSDVKALAQAQSAAGDYATTIFMIGWASGGLLFGILGDRIGRARTMVLTILMYSIFTGFSSFAKTTWDFGAYRFLTGLGVGGEFAVGVALVAEVMPAGARAHALASLQALSAIGNVSAALINLGLGAMQEQGLIRQSPWRIMFLIGAVPAVLALVIMRRLKEPEQWQKVSHQGDVASQLGSYRALFCDPTLRRHALLGLLLACAGVIGLWSVGFFTMDLIRSVQKEPVTAGVYNEQIAAAAAAGNTSRADDLKALLAAQSSSTTSLAPRLKALQDELSGTVSGRLARWSSYASIAINLGAALGMLGFGALSQRIGRKRTFALAFLAAFVTTVSVFWYLQDFWQVWVMVPVMGFCQLSLFAGYAIYFPELFPTRLRSTGTSFCYNVGRFLAAFGPVVKAHLENVFRDTAEPMRYAGCSMCVVFLIGLLALPFLPETKGQPLPE